MSDRGLPAIARSQQWLSADRSAALVRDAQGGTAAELDVLLGSLRPSLYGYFAHRVDPASADDLAQQALLAVAREYRVIAADHASRWIVTVARNVLRDEFRREARAASRRAPVHDALAIPSADNVVAHSEFHELAEAVVDATTTACSGPLRAVVLCLLRGLDISEIAHDLGVSEPTVRVRLMRARVRLRHELRRFSPLARRAGASRGTESGE